MDIAGGAQGIVVIAGGAIGNCGYFFFLGGGGTGILRIQNTASSLTYIFFGVVGDGGWREGAWFRNYNF